MPEPIPPREPLRKEDLLVEASKIREKLQELLNEVKDLISQTKKLAEDVDKKSKTSSSQN